MKATYCLIVDDHDQLRTVLCDWLKTIFPDIDFIAAADGESALDLIEQYHPKVVLMDIGLPGISGIETTRRIKTKAPEIIIIIHTIQTDQAYLDDAHLAGADIFISKNKTQNDLIPALNNFFSALGVGNCPAS